MPETNAVSRYFTKLMQAPFFYLVSRALSLGSSLLESSFHQNHTHLSLIEVHFT